MTKDDFIKELASILMVSPEEVQTGSKLSDFQNWDSMSKMAILTLIDTDMGVPVPLDSVQKWETVGDVVTFAFPD